VATSHHGTVEVESALRRGSTFRVRLPVAQGAEVAQRPSKPRKSPSTQELSVPPAGVARVLVVDDQELVRRSLGRLMRAAGHEALFAGDGQQAIDIYRKTTPRPDVVLLDLDMPVLSGAEALERIKEIDPGARVLLVSGYYDEARKRHLLSRGALDFIGKPVDAKKLVAAVRLALAMPR
jgi:CheY-like chemotaxis protein